MIFQFVTKSVEEVRQDEMRPCHNKILQKHPDSEKGEYPSQDKGAKNEIKCQTIAGRCTCCRIPKVK